MGSRLPPSRAQETVLTRLKDLLLVRWGALVLPVVDDTFELLVRHHHALDPGGFAGVHRKIEHVTAAEQLLGAGLVGDDPESIPELTANAMRLGMLALIRPVMMSAEGRCVATTRWMPTARASCATRQISSSTSLPATIIRSASSSMTMMM